MLDLVNSTCVRMDGENAFHYDGSYQVNAMNLSFHKFQKFTQTYVSDGEVECWNVRKYIGLTNSLGGCRYSAGRLAMLP